MFIDFHSTLDTIRGKYLRRSSAASGRQCQERVHPKEHIKEVGDLSQNLTRNARFFSGTTQI
jgi:hypothetical protein